jgi:hypothetical protein
VTSEEPEPIAIVSVGDIPEGTPLVKTDRGLEVPRRFFGRYVHPSRPFVVHATVDIRDDGVPEFSQLTYTIRSGTDIAAVDTRFPYKWVLDALVNEAHERGGTEQLTRPVRGTRRVFTPALLDEIADVVRDATMRGLPIRRAVADYFRLGSEYTARNWIAEARKPGGPLHRPDNKEES